MSHLTRRARRGADDTTPAHYRGKTGLQPIDVIHDWSLGYDLGTVLAYICRADRKGTPLADLRKALAHTRMARGARTLATYQHALSIMATVVIDEFGVVDTLFDAVDAINSIALTPQWSDEMVNRIERCLLAEIARRHLPAAPDRVPTAAADLVAA